MNYSVIHDTIPSDEGREIHVEPVIIRLLNSAMTTCLYAAVFLVPIWFLPFTLDILELNKQTLLVILAMLALLAWLGKAILQKTIILSRSWLHTVVFLFVLGYLVTSLTSQDRYLSLIGNSGQIQWAFATVAAFGVLYFILVNSVKDTTRLYHLLLAFLGSSAFVALLGLLQLTGVYPFGNFFSETASRAFNTIGTSNALAMYLVVPLVLAESLLVIGCRNHQCLLGQRRKGSGAASFLVWMTLILSLAVVVLIDFWAAWVSILFGTICVFGISMARGRSVREPKNLTIQGMLCLLSVVFLIWGTHVKLGLPGEVVPSFSHSWQIAQKVLQEHPFVGSGPGTWMYDYSKYRALSANASQFWSTRFDRGISVFTTLIATVGIVGISLWLILLLSGVVKSVFHLIRERNDDVWQAYLTVFSAWATSVFVSFIYNYNVAHHFAFWFLFALLAALVAQGSLKWNEERHPVTITVLSIFFLALSVGTIAVTWLAGQRLLADMQYSSAVKAFRAGKSVQASIDGLNAAVALNRLNDAYHRNLSQAYLIRIGQVMQSQDPDKALLINQLMSACIDTAKRAIEISPANVDNWVNLAGIYQVIASFTRGADEFAIKNYQEALMREPNNPAFQNEIGKLYILRADAQRTLLSSQDPRVRAEAEANARAELDKAAEQLNRAIQAKPDFALAHYNLAILYERQGRLKEAITKMENVLRVNNQDVGIGFQLALLYYRDGIKDKAQDLLEQILKLDPSYANAHWYLSSLYEESGRYDDAITQIKQLRQSNFDPTLISQRLEQLTRARDERRKPRTQPIPEPIKEEVRGSKSLNGIR